MFNKDCIFSLVLIIVLIVVDQFTKLVASEYGLVKFNKYLSLGFGRYLEAFHLIIISVFLLFIIIWLINKNKIEYNHGMSLILAGSISNLIDRVIFQAIRDYISVPFINVCNNVADWYIFIGCIYYIFIITKQQKNYDK